VSISIPPPVSVFLAKTPLFNKFDLSSLKIIWSGAAPLAKETETQVKARFNDEIVYLQGYGQTEATLGTLYGTYGVTKSGSVGQPVKGIYAKVIDENGKSLGPNKVGELCFKGALISKGYLKNEKATKEIIDKDGWLHTGDLGYYDDDQDFFIVDRLKELIKFKGFQVPPAELEALLITHPKVKDCGVIGISDEAAGELPFAFVVKQPYVELSEDEIKNFVKENASNAKWLRGGVKFIEEIPKNPSGKILRRELRDLYKSLKAKL
jgi:acyl-CoA synthetase (AMP-forming)/AMP-acid ligase II